MNRTDDTLAGLYAQHLAETERRYATLLDALDYAHAVVFAGAPRYVFQDDWAYPFKVNHHFKSWLPLTRCPQSHLVVTPGARPKLIYYQPRDYWHVPPGDPAGFWVEHFDIRVIRDPDEARQELPRNLARCALIGEPTPAMEGWGFGGINPPRLVDALHYERVYKSAYEVECIARANRIGARAHRAAEQAFREGASELAIRLAYVAASEQTEDELPYYNIVALNEHAAVLHYDVYDEAAPEAHRSFLIDAGASCNGYASDITRTYAADGDGAFAALIAALDEAQQALLGSIEVGRSYVDLHVDTHRRIATILKDAGLLRTDPEQAVENHLTSYFFPHGLGHHLGLQVHDAGGKLASPDGTPLPQPEHHPYLRNLRMIEAGNVFTIEPGVYFIDLLLDELETSPHASDVDWDVVRHLRPYGGIRIEDNVHVGESDTRNLTREAFATLA